MYNQNSYPSYDQPPQRVQARPTQSPRTKMRARSPVYAIDFSCQAAGKRIATTKRRIRWRWGYTNRAALDAGKAGMECRGEEHDVILVWSVTSGKRQILMDGQEVHFSASRASIIDFSWTTKGNHVMKVVAHASPPMSASQINSTFRQYDLFIDGQSFFTMPKVFELGLKGDPQAYARRPGDVSHYRENQDDIRRQEDEDLQRAIRHSIAESRAHLAERPGDASSAGGSYNDGYGAYGGYGGGGGYNHYPSPSPAPHDQSTTMGMELLGVGSPSAAPAPTFDTLNQASYAPAPQAYPSYSEAAAPANPSYPSAPVASNQPPLAITYANSTAPPAYTADAAPTNNLLPPTPNNTASEPAVGQLLSPGFSASPAPVNSGFPVQTVDDPFAPKPPTKDEVHSALLGLYDAPAADPVTQPVTPAGSAVPQPDFGTPPVSAANPNLTMNSALPITNEETVPLNPFEEALQNLVNIDDISAPATNISKLSMSDPREEEKKKKNEKKGKSTAIPPVASGMVGENATLSQINAVKTEKPLPDPAEIMKPPPPNAFNPNAGGAGMLVVHGQGPPPLPQGFGNAYGQPPRYGAQTGY